MMCARYLQGCALALILVGSGTLTAQRTLYRDGQIITLSAGDDVHNSMLVVGEHIVATGTDADAALWETPGTRVVDLGGRTVVPGFIDAHSHFPSSGIRRLAIDLNPPPIGTVATRAQLLERVARAAERQPGTGWLLGFNYDNAAFADGRHPTRGELDSVSGVHPVYLWHRSGHMGVANSQALLALGYDERSPSLPGALIGTNPVDGRLSGLLQEHSAPPLARLLAEFSRRDLWKAFTGARDDYLSAGVTTVQNGYAGAAMTRLLDWAERLGVLPQRVLIWPSHDKLGPRLMSQVPGQGSRDYLRIGAVKIIVDGSPQGLTAALSKPYFPASGVAKGYAGLLSMSADELQAWVSTYHRAGYQLALHGNGDAAIDVILDAVARAQASHPAADRRHLLVHAQTLRADQVLRLKELGMSPSFFVGHTYYWGDWHRNRTLGPRRAATISPTGWAVQAGVRFSLHADTPVTPMQPMQMLWSATRRETLSGVVLGSEQRITRLQALRALTLDAAWQNFLDDSRGSLEAGKLADFVVLSGNPLFEDDVRDIQVLQSVIGGQEVYRRPAVKFESTR